MVMDENFLKLERDATIQQVKLTMKEDDTLLADIKDRHLNKINLLTIKFKIVAKYISMPPALLPVWKDVVIKYTKEETLYRELTELPFSSAFSNPKTDTVEEFSDWLDRLNYEELTIIANLITDL
jgi:hypothetical protein